MQSTASEGFGQYLGLGYVSLYQRCLNQHELKLTALRPDCPQFAMLGHSQKAVALCSGSIMLVWQSELGKPAQQDPGADLPGLPATPIPLNQQIHNGYVTIPADTRGYIVDRLGNSTLPAAVGGSEGPAEAKPGACLQAAPQPVCERESRSSQLET